jgi:hypothetical protein
MFNEVRLVSSEWPQRIHKRTLMRTSGAQLPRSALTLQPPTGHAGKQRIARASAAPMKFE